MSDRPTLSDLLLRFVEANPDQLVGNETAQQWVELDVVDEKCGREIKKVARGISGGL